MAQWPSTRANRVLSALLRIGWSIKRQSGSHRTLQRSGSALDSLQLTAKHKVSTPVNWKPGGDVIISGAVSDEEAKQKFPGGWKSPLPYMRVVPQPK